MKKKITYLIVCAVFVLANSSLSAKESLPAPIDSWELPISMDSGFDSAGLIGEPAGDGAPAISAISENTLPGETLVMSGDDLEGASLKIWSEGEVYDVEALAFADDRLTAVVPEDAPAATMIVWACKDGSCGSPIRVNAPQGWWSFPERVEAKSDKVLNVYGKNFVIGEFDPKAYIKGSGFEGFAEIISSNPYKLEIDVEALKSGDYSVWIHNGSGGDYGWSEPIGFSVEKEREKKLKVFKVEDFGAIAGDGKPDDEAIQRTVSEAVKAGGGIVRFSDGRYLISRQITVPGANVHFEGVGKGDYELCEEKTSGKSTVLRYKNTDSIPDSILNFKAKNCSVRDMTIINAADGNKRNVVVFNASSMKVENIRVIMFDKRDWGYKTAGPWQSEGAKRDMSKITKKIIDKGAIVIDTKGAADVVIKNCELHTTGPGIQIGEFSGWGTSKSKPLSDSVLIKNTSFRGYYSGEPDGKPNAGASGRATGVVLYGGRKVAVEDCSFEGVDRFNGKTMCRTVLAFNTYGRNYYFAGNESRNVGPHPSAIGMNDNQGEQYLIHYRNLHGGLFDVVNSRGVYTTITTENVGSFEQDQDDKQTSADDKKAGRNWDTTNPHFYYDNTGSQVLDEVREGDNWILYVSKGKGAGQYRIIRDFKQNGEKYVFKLNKKWRVAPNASSRVHLMPAYRHIVIYDNFADTGRLVEETKTHGVCLWFYNFDNIIADNTFRNMTSGIIINSRFSGPTGWNTTRRNTIENIRGYCGDTSLKPAGYVDHFRLTLKWSSPEDRLWYQVGNVCRDNIVKNSVVGAYLHTRYTGYVRKNKPETVPHPDSGIMMSVIENNSFTDVGQGIVVSSPLNTCVVRKNYVKTKDDSCPPIYNQDKAADLVKTIIKP